jgi:hypothetical protein
MLTLTWNTCNNQLSQTIQKRKPNDTYNHKNHLELQDMPIELTNNPEIARLPQTNQKSEKTNRRNQL